MIRNLVLGATAATIGFLSINVLEAQAGQLHQGWNYGIDSFNDGYGGSNYDIKGMAIKDDGNQLHVALTGGMPLGGIDSPGYYVGWSELFFNFSGKTFVEASQDRDLYAVRFTTADGFNIPTGVYNQVRAKSSTAQYYGPGSLYTYYTVKSGKYDQNNTQGTDLPTKESAYEYFYGSEVASNPTYNNTRPLLNAMESGTKVGDISMLSTAQLSSLGLDFGRFAANGTYTFGFSFDKQLIGSGDYVSNIFLDCANDGVALKTTPEPTTTAGLFVVALGLCMTRIRKYRHQFGDC